MALSDVPLEQYEAAANRVTMLSEPVEEPFSVYNLTGRPFSRMTGDFGTYVRRVGDIEGVRRAALLTVNLRDSNTPVSSVPAALAASPLRNPYDGQAFVWDETRGAIVFQGLEEDVERREHRLLY